MIKIIRILLILPAILFITMGLRWIVAPTGIAGELGLTLMDGVGLSSQIGDMSAFFLTLGLCALMGVVTENRTWFYPPVIMLALTALGRVLAWLLYDASFAGALIAPEVLIALLWYFGSAKICQKARS
ncbi:MAG: hypothetical protein COB54_06930 [Alphaproteobacteria bacterium]|nr:MAG: hypothetical protein COB54_06930 [Alphaproteobacteria bacterium]